MDTARLVLLCVIAPVAVIASATMSTRARRRGHHKTAFGMLCFAALCCVAAAVLAGYYIGTSKPSTHQRLNDWLHHNRAVISSQRTYVNPDGSWTVLFTTPGTCKGMLTADVDPTTSRVTITGSSTNEPDCLDEVGFDIADTDLGQFV